MSLSLILEIQIFSEFIWNGTCCALCLFHSLFLFVLGAGSGDDETITIDLSHWSHVNGSSTPILCVVINIYSGSSSFKSIRNCFARLLDDKNKELCRFNLTEQHDTQAMIMCHIERRVTGCWGMSADGVGCSGKRAEESTTAVINMLFTLCLLTIL